jgi:tyrosyl-tRNA synthetase
MVFDATPGCAEMLAREKITCYIGFDPSTKSLHIGNLIPIMGLVNMQRHGHTPIAIVGGGTGMIGDPGGRKDERQLLTREKIEENVEGIRAQLEKFLDFRAKSNPAKLVNNADWLLKLGLVDFLRDTGKHFTVNYMLDKESVKARLGRDSGISYTEFSYMLLQAYDSWELYKTHACRMQMGGSDQWGNILAGVDLIKRVEATKDAQGNVTGYSRGEPHAMVYPLVTTASGEKFGKSIGGAPTLDPAETSPYRLYQYFLNTDDRDVTGYLKRFTLLGPADVAPLEEAVRADPGKREAQRRLAADVTLRVHGQSGLDQAKRVTDAFFGGELARLSARDIEDVLTGAPAGEVPRSSLEGAGIPFDRFAVAAGLCASNAEARRLVEQGGLYLNDTRVEDARAAVTLSDLIEGRVAVLRRGSRTYRLVRVTG